MSPMIMLMIQGQEVVVAGVSSEAQLSSLLGQCLHVVTPGQSLLKKLTGRS